MGYTILIYIIIAIACNGLYFFACNGEYPDCGTISMIFVNIAVLSQFLPLITSTQSEEKNQKNGQHLLCSIYLVIEILVAAFCLIKDKSLATAGSIQIILLSLFLIVYFSIAKANLKTNTSIREANVNRSSPILDACASLKIAIAECQNPIQRNILRETYAELSSMPSVSNFHLNQIDGEILTNISILCQNPNDTLKKELSRLINRRKTMLMVISQ